MITTVALGRPSSIAAVEAHLETSEPLVLVPQRDPDEDDPALAGVASVGVLSRALRATRTPDGNLRVLVQGMERARMVGGLFIDEGVCRCEIDTMPEADDDPIAVGGAAHQLASLFAQWSAASGFPPPDHVLLASAPDDPVRLADQVASTLPLSLIDRIAMLEEPSILRRLQELDQQVAMMVAAHEINVEINEKVQEAMDKGQREYHLREQIKVLRAELGDELGTEAEADRFKALVLESGMPDEARDEALREVERLRRIHTDSAEYTITRTWLETLCDVPWSKATTDQTDLVAAQVVLDEDHYGLEKVKERVLEYLAVRQLQPDSKGPILCFVGPPGVGKTSLGRSIARTLGRHFGRIALGGIKDETEIRGHRRTYIGAMPGRIIRAITRAGSRNPVFVLDELDKLGADFRGDPASALLEVLDPEQNVAFVDHYLDVPVDLSQVLFIATANLADPIPPALYDRLEVIEIPGYTEEAKVKIARQFLLPKLATAHGLENHKPVLHDRTLQRLIRDYTREAGLRNLERELASLHRKVARQVVEGRKRAAKITDKSLQRYLGPPRFYQELAERVDQPGVVIGLAWTASGGDILFIEATRMPGKESLKLTGSLGSVMKESAEAAMSWLRTNADAYGLEPSVFEAAFHLHVPAGAIPKDGPSAGVTMVSSLASLVTGRPVRSKLAMTGEITLRGKVLPVGGVKEKVLAARRAGIETVLLPKHNENDLVDIPKVLRRDLTFHFVDTVHEVLELALVPKDGE